MKYIFTKRFALQAAVTLLGLLIVAAILPHQAQAAPLGAHVVPQLMPLMLFPAVGMLLDVQTQLSAAQALTVGTTVSTYSYDTAIAKRDIFRGAPLCLLITVDVTAVVSGGDETYTFECIESAAAALSGPTILAQVAIARALLVAGKQIVLPIPPGLKVLRYIGAQYVLAGAASAITVTAEIQPLSAVQTNAAYPSGYLIDS